MTSPLLSLLLRASLEGALFVLLVGAVTRLAGRMPASARCALWWFASLRLLLALAPLPALRVPVPSWDAAPDPMFLAGAPVVTLASPIVATVSPVAPISIERADIAGALDPLGALAAALLAVWLAGVLAVALVHGRDARRLMRLWREAVPVDSSIVRGWLTGWVGAGRADRVELRASASVGSPLIMGGLRTRILIPSVCLSHDAARLRMALAHEMSHVRRGDLGWGLVPAIAECVFWFHPLVRWCVREYAQTREEACDAEALRLSDATPHGYGELLVGFGVDSTRHAHAAACCGSSHVQQLKRRLSMLAHAPRSTRTQRTLAAVATLVIGLLAILPARFVAAGAPADDSSASGSECASGSESAVQARTATAAAASAARSTASKASTSSTKSKSSGGSFSYDTGDGSSDDLFAYGYSHGDGVTMSGSFDTDNDQWLERLKEEADGDFAWFRVDGKTYLVNDREGIERIQEIMRPEIELGEQQGALGERQGRLGGQQSELGGLQAALGEEQSELSDRLEQNREDARDDGSRHEELERQRDELEAKMEMLSAKMREIARLQEKLGAEQRALGEKQTELGRRQQATTRQIDSKMRELSREMIRNGKAVLIEE